MKNKNILPNTLVPKKLRFKLYKQAYEDIMNDNPIVEGLCVSLPMYLWDLDHVIQFAPNGEDWKTDDTPNMFPELKKELIRLEIYGRGMGFMNPKDRIAFLERILKEYETNKTTSTQKK